MGKEQQSRTPNRWICNDLVCLVDGLAFGLDEEMGETFCIGKAVDLLAALNGEGVINERVEQFAFRAGISECLCAGARTPTEVTGEGPSVHPSECKGKALRRKYNHRLPERVINDIRKKTEKGS